MKHAEMDPEFIAEMWDAIRSYIPPKDRLEAADVFVATLDSYGYGDLLEGDELLESSVAKELRTAIKSRFEGLDEEEHD